MYVSAQERPFDTFASGFGGLAGDGAIPPEIDPLAVLPGGDAVSRLLAPSGAGGPLGAAASFGTLASPMGALGPLLRSLRSLLEQLSQLLGGASGAGGASGGRYFQQATASSTGDPHLAFSGGGEDAHWDSMTGHDDLLDSGSFPGGFRIATQTTAPDANGVTFNRSASVVTGGGSTCVTLDDHGRATIQRNGRTCDLEAGRSFDLGNGERVRRDADGSVDITERNAMGGSIETTLRGNGRGVDVNVAAHGVRLGGDLVRGAVAPGISRPHTPLEPLESGFEG